MTVRELKDYLNSTDRYDDNEVKICINTPENYVCPDGAVVDVERVSLRGIDWYRHHMLIVPSNKLNLEKIDNWKIGKSDYQYD